jgi:hypothetical protein
MSLRMSPPDVKRSIGEGFQENPTESDQAAICHDPGVCAIWGPHNPARRAIQSYLLNLRDTNRTSEGRSHDLKERRSHGASLDERNWVSLPSREASDWVESGLRTNMTMVDLLRRFCRKLDRVRLAVIGGAAHVAPSAVLGEKLLVETNRTFDSVHA